MEEKVTESKKSDMKNIFEELLGDNNSSDLGNLDHYQNNNPNNVTINSEIFNGKLLVWKGQLDITLKEKNLLYISDKLNTILKVVDIDKDKIVISFNKNKSILSLDYKNKIKRSLKSKLLVNIYTKK